ncbi:MAG: hypothetical protein ACK5GN_02325 [Pseudomonadota bacterium]
MIYNFYSLFRVTARAVFGFVGCCLTSCSSGSTPTTVPLESVAVHHEACKRLSGPLATPVVYECRSEGGRIFATTLKDCSIPEKFTFQTTTRQLFVGLIGLKVVSQEPVQIGSTRALQTVVSGTLDAEPVLMSAFTFRKRNCVTDIVLWQGSDSTQVATEKIDQFTRSSSQLTFHLLDDSTTVHEDADVTG